MFIIIEGIDGAGKSRVRERLLEAYPNLKFLDLKEDYEKVKKKSIDVKKDFYKAQFLKHKDDVVIVDRYHISEIVYSKTLRDTNVDIGKFEEEIFGKYINKVTLVVIDVHEEIAQERIIKRDGERYGQDLHLERELFKKADWDSVIPTKYLIYNEDFEKVVDGVKEFIESVCGVSGKILKT